MSRRHDQRKFGHLILVNPNCTHVRAYRHPSGRVFCPDCTRSWTVVMDDTNPEFEDAIRVLVENGLLTDTSEVKDEE